MSTKVKKKRPTLGTRVVEGLHEIAAHSRGTKNGVVEFTVKPGDNASSIAKKIRAATPRRTARKTKIATPPEIAATTAKKIRESLGVSQQLFADFLGVGVGLVRAWEGGGRVPKGADRRLLEDMNQSPEHWRERVQQSFVK